MPNIENYWGRKFFSKAGTFWAMITLILISATCWATEDLAMAGQASCPQQFEKLPVPAPKEGDIFFLENVPDHEPSSIESIDERVPGKRFWMSKPNEVVRESFSFSPDLSQGKVAGTANSFLQYPNEKMGRFLVDEDNPAIDLAPFRGRVVLIKGARVASDLSHETRKDLIYGLVVEAKQHEITVLQPNGIMLTTTLEPSTESKQAFQSTTNTFRIFVADPELSNRLSAGEPVAMKVNVFNHVSPVTK